MEVWVVSRVDRQCGRGWGVTWSGLIDLLDGSSRFTTFTIFNDTVMSIDGKFITILLVIKITTVDLDAYMCTTMN